MKWEIKTLADIAIKDNGIVDGPFGSNLKKSDYIADKENGVPVLTTKNLHGDYTDGSVRYITKEKYEQLKRSSVFPGDILVAKIGSIGTCGIYPLTQRIAIIPANLLKITVLPSMDRKYVYYYILSASFQKRIKEIATATAQPAFNVTKFRKLPIPVPPLEEQQRIVARIEELFSQLDDAEATLQKTKAQLALYRQAVLMDAFAFDSPKTLIRDISSIVTSGSRGWAQYYSEEGARFIRITDLTRDRIQLKNDDVQRVDLPDAIEGKRSQLRPNDVLVSITADLGSIAIIPHDIGEAYINQHIAMIRFINPEQSMFMAWYLKSENGQKDLLRNKRGNGKLGLGLDDIRDTPVPMVSNALANEIVERIDSRLSICENIEKATDLALLTSLSLRQSILRTAFHGGVNNEGV